MHFHLPKPLHSWRAFVGEVGIIVVGVLIALAAEQLVEDWRWRSDVRAADQRMSKELGFDLATAYERFAINSCLRPRLAELRDELLKNDATWPGSRAKFAEDPYKSGFPSVYRTPRRSWLLASWGTALNGGVIGHFHPDRAQQFAGLFEDVAILERSQSEENNTAETLGDLAFAGPITPTERRGDLKLVAKLDALDASIVFDSRVLIEEARNAGLRPDPHWVKQMVDEQRAYRGACVKDLPLRRT